jgi:peptidoglycan/xylan/chitin deacetylase (PgdA/CDA1 family)
MSRTHVSRRSSSGPRVAQRPKVGRTLRVLCYHRVADPARTPGLDPSLVSATPKTFRSQMRHLSRHYRVVTLDEVLAAFRGGQLLPHRAVLLTFDDAYRDFADEAWPILRDLALPATLFVPTAYPGHPDRAFWWDRLHRIMEVRDGAGRGEGSRRNAPRGPAPRDYRARLKGLSHQEAVAMVDRMEASGPAPSAPGSEPPAVLDWDELRELGKEGVSLGAHTRWHSALTRATEETIREELRGSLEDLRSRVEGVPIIVSYPYGLHDDRIIRIAREEGFDLGFTCLGGLNRVGRTDPLRLRRTTVSLRTTPLLFRVRMLPWFATLDRWRHGVKTAISPGSRPSPEEILRVLAGAMPGPVPQPR